jgi:hypothetical protein
LIICYDSNKIAENKKKKPVKRKYQKGDVHLPGNIALVVMPSRPKKKKKD